MALEIAQTILCRSGQQQTNLERELVLCGLRSVSALCPTRQNGRGRPIKHPASVEEQIYKAVGDIKYTSKQIFSI